MRHALAAALDVIVGPGIEREFRQRQWQASWRLGEAPAFTWSVWAAAAARWR